MIKIDEMEIKNTELSILLNCLGENISISYPIYKGFNFCTAYGEEDFFNLKFNKTENDFQVEADKYGKYSIELPSYNDIIECLLASDIIKYQNYKKFESFVKTLNQTGKPVIFSPDSNNLYHRFPSHSGISPQKFFVTNIVKNEIYTAINQKYNITDIRELQKNSEYNSDLFEKLTNKGTKKSRKAIYLAKNEFLFLKNYNARIDENHSETFNNKEKNDEIIVKTLKQWENKESKLVCLLTADNLMAQISELEGLTCFNFKIPDRIELDKCDFYHFSELIYNLACVLGVIKLNSVIILGEYRGKTDLNNLKLKFLDVNLSEKLRKHLKICRKLCDIGIEK